jgi:hypothetical protein
MLNYALSLKNGNWLGSYSDLNLLTLAKAPGYSLYLTVNSYTNFSPPVFLHYFLILSTFVIVISFNRLKVNQTFSTIFYCFVVLNPIWFSDHYSRTYREGLLAINLFIILSLSLYLFCISSGSKLNYFQILIATVIGINIGFLTITKNTSVFALILVFSFLIYLFFLNRNIAQFFILAFTVCSILLLPPQIVKSLNNANYQVSLLDDFNYGEYPSLIKNWASVNGGSKKDFVLIDSKMREQVYAVSPKAKILEPFLETASGIGWKASSCTSLGICDESSAWFPWELRDAFVNSGLANSPLDFQRNLALINQDIKNGCEAKLIGCSGTVLLSGTKPIQNLSAMRLIDSVFFLLNDIWTSSASGVGLMTGYQKTNTDQYDNWNSILNKLPPNIDFTQYQSNDYFLGDFKIFMNSVFMPFWKIFLLFGIVGLFVTKQNGVPSVLRLLAITSGFLIFSQILILSLFEISVGSYVNSAYLIFIYPLLMLFGTYGNYNIYSYFSIKFALLRREDYRRNELNQSP